MFIHLEDQTDSDHYLVRTKIRQRIIKVKVYIENQENGMLQNYKISK